ncbi:MAG: hypothetical protein A2977_00785 [Alphaproteobacteria bacterium RIFCSPLOWO2_01_FULL_45_8]|nr:MAG: hypothetical protein A2065_03590 [Alphaproteobacteria bacterium GWB1_45_5]OFW75840.1 MAG: hypothetical protein A3K20_03350 [Alphaproteobacteria bacterium GWA1_45_9]OFW89928.1 MAG: hypothetical protein A2621_03550 [Alphaproteobacteria bacterium RIFCSPHIGHO2_01_FULL_41_14]OFW96628.1 MAG: hypothetical protein A2977_00785 [Alphaproteobacteria bacterium RIFCSPLOWO2_01_FULL_45_8]
MPHSFLNGFHNAYNVWYKTTFWGISAVLYCLLGLYGSMHSPGPFSHSVILKVRKGETVPVISQHLYDLGLIRSKFLFSVYLRYTQKDRALKKGQYVFEPYMSEAYIADAIYKGFGIYYRIFIPEGYTNLRIAENIQKYSFLEKDKFRLPPEGMLYPDTYKIEGGTTYSSFISLMQNNMEKNLKEAWQKRVPNLYFKTPEDVLIVASIIEKETNIPHEKHLIAGVIMNRLKRGIKLQMDPTTIYGITKTGVLGRPLKLSDLKRKNAFNTYYISGLPPTPICNPGKSSLEAAVNPVWTSHLFYVATGRGGHAFAETHEHHLRNIEAFRSVLNSGKK